MLTVILGAGASYDSEPITARLANTGSVASRYQWKPPLTYELFDQNRAWFTTPPPDSVTAVLGHIRRGIENGTLEETLEELRSEVEEFPMRWRNIAGIQSWISTTLTLITNSWTESLRNETCFVDMADRLLKWRSRHHEPISVVTFNYDTLFEKAVQITTGDKRRFDEFEGYIGEDFRLFKPHGSIDWEYHGRTPEGRTTLEERPLTKSELYNLPLRKVAGGRVKYLSVPALAIPVTNKSESDFISPPAHMKHMRQALQDTTALLVIGWQGAEQHFMQLVNGLVAPNTPTLVVCGGTKPDDNNEPQVDENGEIIYLGGTTISNLKRLGGLTQVADAKTGFAEFLHQPTA
ncbi:MAG: SIR2 family protein, partial [Alphaproteobacteria bacterium]